jgi:hypothetical protein
MFRNKGKYGHPGGILHVGIHVLLTGLILAAVTSTWITVIIICIAEFFVHYHIDWAKEALGNRFSFRPDNVKFWMLHGSDQAAHQLTYIGIIWWLA